MATIGYGPQTCARLDEGSAREWLVSDGLGGYAMGTASGLRTRRYHGLLVVATQPPIGRQLALASLDAVLVVGDARHRLATHEWHDGTIAPDGHTHLASFAVRDGVPVWRWVIGDVVIERELAMAHGRPCVGVVHRVVRAPAPVTIELEALCTWRDVHGERFAYGTPSVTPTADGFVFEGAYRVRGPGFVADGDWYRGVRYRAEAARGLNAVEDLWRSGRFVATLTSGQVATVEAWAGGAGDQSDLGNPPSDATVIVDRARARANEVAARVVPDDDTDRLLAHAADQLIVAGPTVVAGYPWFGDWSRDTMTSYEGLFLDTGRHSEGRDLLTRLAASVSEGMLANTADAGGTEYNTVDAAMWFLHAVPRHIAVTGDTDLAASIEPTLRSIIEHHQRGTRFGIVVDASDGLVTQGAPGWALTWMDARVDGTPITPRWGKPVEVNALWCSGLAAVADLQRRLGRDDSVAAKLAEQASASFVRRFVRANGGGLFDVVDGPDGDDASVRPNQLLAASLPHAPFADRAVVDACAPLMTSLGLRSLAPSDPRYLPHHRGGPAERDRAYHQGTVWPWLVGPYVEASVRLGIDAGIDGVLDGLQAHLADAGIGSVSETADAAAPYETTGCPFQAWSVAELIRARRLVRN